MSTMSMTKRLRVVAGAIALTSVATAGWGGSIAPAHAATAATAATIPVERGRVSVVPRRYPSPSCYRVPGGYRQANIHNGGGYIGWVQVYLLYCPDNSNNYAEVYIHLRSGVVVGHADVNRLAGPDGGAASASSGTVYAGDNATVDSPGVYSPDNLADACWGDSADYICTPAV